VYIFEEYDRYVHGEFVRGAPYHRCGFMGLFSSGHYDLGGLIHHELISHGRDPGTIFAAHDFTDFYENENVHRAHHQALACAGRR